MITSGTLCFDITPNQPFDDYDWAVYDVTSDPCGAIYSNSALEVSCNYSGTSGVTGPNGSGGPQNEPCIAVTAGETYVINVSQFSTSTNGYTLDFGSSTASIFDNVPPEIEAVAQPIACGSNTISFNFTENILCNTVADGDFVLTGPGGPYTLSNISGPNCDAGGTQEDDFTMTVSPVMTTSGNFQICLVNGSGSVTDLCGNIAPPACLDFTITNGVFADAGADATICAGAAGVGIGGSPAGSGGTSPLDYSWSPTTGLSNSSLANPTASPGSTTTYTLTVTDANGCQATDEVTITVDPAPIVSVNDATICEGASAVLTASGATTYSWSPATGLSGTSGTSVTASPVTTTTYTVTGSTPGCPNDTETSTVTVKPLPTANFTISGDFCEATADVDFNNTPSYGGAGTYGWTFPGGSPAASTRTKPNRCYLG